MNSLLVSTPQGTQPVRGNNDQEETEQRDFRRVLLRADSPVSPVLHGIRADVAERQQLFKHDAYKGVFKMEATKDYYVWSFTMTKFLEDEAWYLEQLPGHPLLPLRHLTGRSEPT